jgi:hypothetical protein
MQDFFLVHNRAIILNNTCEEIWTFMLIFRCEEIYLKGVQTGHFQRWTSKKELNMEHLNDLLPKDKFDIDTVEKLKGLKREELIPLLPKLLEWIQDMNWIIAPKIAELLLDFPNEIIPYIRKVFESKDDIWKFWCLEVLVKNLPSDLRKVLKNDLIRLAERPSDSEKLEEVDIKAKEILKQL